LVLAVPAIIHPRFQQDLLAATQSYQPLHLMVAVVGVEQLGKMQLLVEVVVAGHLMLTELLVIPHPHRHHKETMEAMALKMFRETNILVVAVEVQDLMALMLLLVLLAMAVMELLQVFQEHL
jgi:hypothetical protein